MTLLEKLSAIQQEIKAPKNLTNKFGGYKYRNAEGILEAVKPYEAKYSVAFTIGDEAIQIGDRYYIKATATILDTESAETYAVSAWAREAETKKGMDDSQITGTASSYARKYALNGLLLLDDSKDADSDEYAMQTLNAIAADAKKREIADDPTLNKAQVATLEKLIPQHNQTVENVLKAYKVKSLADLTTTQFKKLMKDMGEDK